MSIIAQTTIGIFSNVDDAEKSINELESKNYNPKDISIVMKDQEKGEKLAEAGADVAGSTMSGATTGLAVGALAGLLVSAGIIPGLGALFIGGPLVASLGLTGAAATTASGAATGALAGGVLGVLNGLGLAGQDAAEYEESIKQGGILIAVPTREGNEDEVRSILTQFNADKIRTIDNS